MSSFLTGLLANLAVVAVVIVLWTIVRDRLPKLVPRSQSLIYGAFMGAGAIASMLLPQPIAPGMFADMRSGLVAVAGFFEGPLAALAAGAIACLWRGGVGGVGARSGCLGIAIVAAVAVAGRALLGRKPIRERHILFLAIAVSLAPNLAIVALPKGLWPLATAHIEPVLGMTLVATTLAGLAILQDRRRRDLLEKDRIYRAIIETLPDCLNVKDLEGRFIAANPATARLMRVGSAAELIGKTDFDFYPEKTSRVLRTDEEKVLFAGIPRTIDQEVAFDDGTRAWLNTLKAPLSDEKGRAIGLITHNRDVTAQHALREELRVTELQLEDALEYMADGLVLYDKNNRIVLCNRQYLRLFPLTSDIRRPGAHLAEILRTSLARGESRLGAGIEAEGWIAERCRVNAFPGDRVIELLDGRCIEARTRTGSGGGALSLLTDITERRRTEDKLAALNVQLAELALTDGLTGICNRRGLDQALAKEFARGARDAAQLSVLLFDVDHFKAYTTTTGTGPATNVSSPSPTSSGVSSAAHPISSLATAARSLPSFCPTRRQAARSSSPKGCVVQ